MSGEGRAGGAPDPLSFLLDISRRVQGSEALESLLSTLTEGLARLQGWDVAEAWVLGEDARTIEVGASWVRQADLRPFVLDAAGRGYQPGHGIVRRAWESRQAAWYEDLSRLPRAEFLRWRGAERHGLRSGALAPIAAGERTLAVLLLLARGRRQRDDDALRLARAASAQVAWPLERRLHRRELERAHERYREVAEQARGIVSERARERDLLQASEERFRAVFEQSPLGITVSTVDEGRFRDVNPRFLEMIGLGRDAVVGARAETLGFWEQRDERRRFLEAIGRDGYVRGFPTLFRHRDGRARHFAISASVIHYAGGQALLSLTEDLTHQHELELERERQSAQLREQAVELERRVSERTAQLSAVNRELEGFTYSVSHDLRAPLRAIDGFSLALLEDYGDRLDERAGHYLERVRRATQHMGLLIDDLLALSRVGRSELDRQTVDLAELGQEVVDELRAAEPQREVEVALPAAATVAADRNLLRLALQNLLGNAWKFTAKVERARIQLTLEERPGERVATVADNGAGFDMRYAEQLFVPFQRLHSIDEFPGTGIGLATVRRIVRRHGGRIWAEGEVGRGAAFHFTLGEEEG